LRQKLKQRVSFQNDGAESDDERRQWQDIDEGLHCSWKAFGEHKKYKRDRPRTSEPMSQTF